MRRALLSLLVLLAASTASATVARYLELPEQVALSQVIVHGQVVSRNAATDSAGRPATDTTLLILNTYKGGNRPGTTLSIRQVGGPGTVGVHVAGDARFTDGEEVVVLLRDVGEPHLYLTALAQSKYTVVAGPGGPQAIRDLSGLGFYTGASVVDAEEPPVSLPILESVLRGNSP